MSRKLPGGSPGGSHSFGGSSSSGSRSFGGTTPGRSARRLGGSGSSSGGSSGGSDGFDGFDDAGGTMFNIGLDLIFIAGEFFGLPGVVGMAVLLLLIYIGMNHPIAFCITFGIGLILVILLLFLRKNKKETRCNISYERSIVDILVDGKFKKYNKDIIYDDMFMQYLVVKLRDRDLLASDGDLRDDRIDIAVASFDEIYRSYVNQRNRLQ